MIDDKLQHDILGALYRAYYERDESEEMNELAQRLGVDGRRFDDSFGFLQNKKLADRRQSRQASITPSGILYAEEMGLAPQELASRQADVRTRVLDALGRLCEGHGLQEFVFYQTIIEEAKLDEAEFRLNYPVLQQENLIEPGGNAGFKMTHPGAEVLHNYRVRVERRARFDNLKTDATITPQRRGHELERLLEEIIATEGWGCERNVRGRNEEHDLVVHQGLHYFLTQCKWEKDRTQTGVIQEMAGRLGSRAGVNGLLISMSGFTLGGSEEPVFQLANRLILLFGPKDVEAMFDGRNTFTALMESKMHASIIRRKAVFE